MGTADGGSIGAARAVVNGYIGERAWGAFVLLGYLVALLAYVLACPPRQAPAQPN